LCDDQGTPLRTTIDTAVPAEQAFNAVYNSTRTLSLGLGGSLQLSVRHTLSGHANQLIVGTSYDGSQVAFAQTTQLGHLTFDRAVTPDGPSITGAGIQTDLSVNNHLLGVYVVDSFNITHSLSMHASARFNWFDTTLEDHLGDALNGQHVFARVNPALGLTQQLGSKWTLFAGYGESNRAPSAAELACADPDQPCRLPNAFITDPPLKQVVSRSAELGVRLHAGAPEDGAWINGSLAAFGTRNHDDILFVAGSHVGTGYFRNAGETQRVGVELALRGAVGPVAWYAAYTLLRATFESELELPRNQADADADAAGGDERASQQVHKGSRIPGLPMHSVKAGVSVRITPPLEVSLSLIGQSSQPFRGDEANESPFLNGFVILNAQASYQLFKPLTLFVRAQNLLNTQYSTFGVLANPSEVLPGTSDPRFQGPGAPFGIFAGLTFADRSL
jgi:outer membrane receptor protein involved in Fe transport